MPVSRLSPLGQLDPTRESNRRLELHDSGIFPCVKELGGVEAGHMQSDDSATRGCELQNLSVSHSSSRQEGVIVGTWVANEHSEGWSWKCVVREIPQVG